MPASRYRPQLERIRDYFAKCGHTDLSTMLDRFLASSLLRREAIDWINLYIDVANDYVDCAATEGPLTAKPTLSASLAANVQATKPEGTLDAAREVFRGKNLVFVRVMTFTSFTDFYFDRIPIFSDAEDEDMAATIRKYAHLVNEIPGLWRGKSEEMVWAGQYAEIKRRTGNFSIDNCVDYLANVLGIPEYVGELVYFVYSSRENDIRIFKPSTLDAGSEINPGFVTTVDPPWGLTCPLDPGSASTNEGCREIVHPACTDLKLRMWGFISGLCSPQRLNLDVPLDEAVRRGLFGGCGAH